MCNLSKQLTTTVLSEPQSQSHLHSHVSARDKSDRSIHHCIFNKALYTELVRELCVFKLCCNIEMFHTYINMYMKHFTLIVLPLRSSILHFASLFGTLIDFPTRECF